MNAIKEEYGAEAVIFAQGNNSEEERKHDSTKAGWSIPIPFSSECPYIVYDLHSPNV